MYSPCFNGERGDDDHAAREGNPIGTGRSHHDCGLPFHSIKKPETTHNPLRYSTTSYHSGTRLEKASSRRYFMIVNSRPGRWPETPAEREVEGVPDELRIAAVGNDRRRAHH